MTFKLIQLQPLRSFRQTLSGQKGSDLVKTAIEVPVY